MNNIPEVPMSSSDDNDANKNPFASSQSAGETKTKVFGFFLTKQEQDALVVGCRNQSVNKELQPVLRRLLRKANQEELEMMHRILCSESRSPEWRVALATLTEEMQRIVN